MTQSEKVINSITNLYNRLIMVYKDIVVFSNYESPNDSDIQIVPFCWECFLYSFVLVLDGMTEKQLF